MSIAQPSHESRRVESGRVQQHKQMKRQISRLAKQNIVIFGHRSKGSFHTYLADLLRDAARRPGAPTSAP